MKSVSQVAHIEDCFETLDEAKEEIRRLNKNRAFLRESITSMQAETTRLAEALKEAREQFENIIRDRAERDKVLITANSGINIIVTALNPAPISGAKKE